jgi:hypothetical protein
MNYDQVNKSHLANNMKLTYGSQFEELGKANKMEGKDPCEAGYEMVGTKMKDGREVPNCVPKNVKKGEYTQEQLKELIAEHERLIKVIESSDKEDDKKELERQKEELAHYKSKLNIEKAQKPSMKAGEKPITLIHNKTKQSIQGVWRTMSGSKIFVSSNGKLEISPEHVKEKYSESSSGSGKESDSKESKSEPKFESKSKPKTSSSDTKSIVKQISEKVGDKKFKGLKGNEDIIADLLSTNFKTEDASQFDGDRVVKVNNKDLEKVFNALKKIEDSPSKTKTNSDYALTNMLQIDEGYGGEKYITLSDEFKTIEDAVKESKKNLKMEESGQQSLFKSEALKILGII